MRIADYTTEIQNLSDTRTIQNFGALLGTKPHKMGQVASLYPYLTFSYLTSALQNIYTHSKASKFTAVKAMAVEWQINVNFLKKVYVAENCTDTGLNKGQIRLILEEKYFDPGETVVLENRQMLYLTAAPRKLGARRFEHIFTLVGNDLSKTVDLRFLQKGRYLRYRSNYYGEASERGYVKYTSNVEIHRNYISRHRASSSKSGDYAVMEHTFIADGKSKDGKDLYFKLDPAEKQALDHLMFSRENNMLFGKNNFDQNGKCLDQDEQGRDVPMGDGVVTSMETYGEKFPYSIFDISLFEDIISNMRTKSDEPLGNTYTFMVNERLYDQIQKALKNDLRFNNPTAAYYFSLGAAKKGMNPEVKVGANFVQYEFAGNRVTFTVNRALSIEHPDKGYGIMVDTGVTSGTPNIAMFTLEGREMISGTLNGMGGQDGRTSGPIATSTDGSGYHLLSYSCGVVFNPYKTAIIEENRIFA